MLKLNNKGLAISSLIFSILIIFLMITFSLLALLGTRKMNLEKLKQEVLEKIESDNTGATYSFGYTGDMQVFTAPQDGNYKFEAWGAQGGETLSTLSGNEYGSGSYTSGNIYLTAGQTIYVYVGSKGVTTNTLTNAGGYNGGGASGNNAGYNSYGGGGATDFRLTPGTWNNSNSLSSRIMVAAAGGGTVERTNVQGGDAGGLIGYNGDSDYTADIPTGATQISGGIGREGALRSGLFGYGIQTNTSGWGGGGGSGYYAGANGYGKGGSGGSSYISGHTGAVAIKSQSDQTPKDGCTTGTTDNTCSIHYSDFKFSNTTMIDGAGYNWTNVVGAQTRMPTPTENFYDLGTGHNGDGYARITLLN